MPLLLTMLSVLALSSFLTLLVFEPSASG